MVTMRSMAGTVTCSTLPSGQWISMSSILVAGRGRSGGGVVVGEIAAAADHVFALLHCTCGDVDDGAGCVARAPCRLPDELEFEPVVVIGIDVAEEDGVAVHDADDGVDFAIVEEITDGHAAAGNDVGEAGAFDGGDVLK